MSDTMYVVVSVMLGAIIGGIVFMFAGPAIISWQIKRIERIFKEMEEKPR